MLTPIRMRWFGLYVLAIVVTCAVDIYWLHWYGVSILVAQILFGLIVLPLMIRFDKVADWLSKFWI